MTLFFTRNFYMKDFNSRNKIKEELHNERRRVFVNEREVRVAHLGINIGFEEDGKGESFVRPVLVIKRLGNLFFVVPLTTKGKDNRFYHALPGHYFNQTSRIILSQVRAIDRNRFARKIQTIDEDDFLAIKEKLKAFLL